MPGTVALWVFECSVYLFKRCVLLDSVLLDYIALGPAELVSFFEEKEQLGAVIGSSSQGSGKESGSAFILFAALLHLLSTYLTSSTNPPQVIPKQLPRHPNAVWTLSSSSVVQMNSVH